MPKSRAFGDALARLRREHGFRSAYAFFKSRGGRENLGLNFRSYLNLEQGKSLPRAATLSAVLGALGLGEHSDEARRLVERYFDALGLSELAGFLRVRAPVAEEDDLERAARKELLRRSAQLTLPQWQLRARDPDANVCHLYLVNTPGGCPLPELAERVRLPLVRVRKAVKALERAGMASTRGSRARSAFEGAALLELPSLPSTAGVIAALKSQRAALSSSALPIREAVIVARLSADDVARVQARLERLLDFVAMCEERSAARDSSIYQFRGELLDLFPLLDSRIVL